MIYPKVSIIIPFFNAERTIDKAIKSALNQSFIDLEIVLIDDGSTDNSPRILTGYLRKDARVKYHRFDNNKGVGFARNKGIEISKGEYITFLDADDWIEKNALEESIKKKGKPTAHFSTFGFCLRSFPKLKNQKS